MASFILIATGLLMLTGSCMLWRAVRNAPEGFEDETGFHRGPTPRPAALLPPVTPKPSRREATALAGSLRASDVHRPSRHAPSL